ncbi:CopD family protein [Streptomyces albiaxialis]|uniref:CopD family protein n=1 Tax=Streptomyces albiaxialis TaxID=329523 RepID=UPI0031DFA6C9
MTQPDSSPRVPGAPSPRQGRHRAQRAVRRRRYLPAVLVLGCVAVLTVVALTGTDITTNSTHDLQIPGGGKLTVLRSVLFVALCVQIGEVAGERLARGVARTLPGGLGDRSPRPWGTYAAVAGMIAALGLASMAAARDGSLTAGLPQLSEIYGTRDGRIAFLEANGFLLSALLLFYRRPVWACVPLAGVVVCEAFRAHPETNTPAIGIGLTLVHLTSTILWTGGLIQVLRTMRAWHGEPGAARALLAAYARRAFWLFAAICVTGTFSTLRRLPLDQAFSSAYGRTLIAKLVLVAAVAVCALFARHVLVKSRDKGTTYGAVLRPTAAELAALGAVLVLSALLTVAPVPPQN